MTNLYLDIETIPGQQSWLENELKSSLSAPSNYKDPEKIAAYIEEASNGLIDKTSFDGAYAHIICISVAIDDSDPISFYAETPDKEKDLLIRFGDFISRSHHSSGFNDRKVFIGHNISGFDIPMIKKRCMILGVEPAAALPLDSKPWDGNPFCTMKKWDEKNFCSLDKLLKAFGIGEKGGIDGSMVYQMWKSGNHEEIKRYCESDVVNVRKLYRKMVFIDKENYTREFVSSVQAAVQSDKPKRLML